MTSKRKILNSNPSAKKAPTPRKGKLDINALLFKIVGLLDRHPPRDLTFSRVSQLTKVPRSTLYYYFGNSSSKMIEEAVRFGARWFSQLYAVGEDRNAASWEEFQNRRLRRVVRMIEVFPAAPALYFRYRNDNSILGQTIRDMENQYASEISAIWKNYQGTDANPLAIRMMGAWKLGFMWGLAIDLKAWQGHPKELEKMISLFNNVIAVIKKTLHTDEGPGNRPDDRPDKTIGDANAGP